MVAVLGETRCWQIGGPIGQNSADSAPLVPVHSSKLKYCHLCRGALNLHGKLQFALDDLGQVVRHLVPELMLCSGALEGSLGSARSNLVIHKSFLVLTVAGSQDRCCKDTPGSNTPHAQVARSLQAS